MVLWSILLLVIIEYIRSVSKKMGGTPLDRKKYWELKRDNISWNELLPMSGLEVNNRDDYLKLFNRSYRIIGGVV